MRLGIDARLLSANTGIGRYTRSLFFEFTRHHLPPGDDLYLFTDTPTAPFPASQSETSGSDAGLPARVHRVFHPCKRRIIWTNWYLPPLLKRHKIDVYHGVCNFELPLRNVCRSVVTIHDLVPLHFPHLVPRKHRLFFTLCMKRAARTADLIITDSHHSKQDIMQHLNVPEQKIRVIYLGYDPPSQNGYDEAALQDIMNKYHIRQPYLLFVGVIEPKKNLERLIEAYALLQQEDTAAKGLQLVIAGGKGWFTEQLYRNVQHIQGEHQIMFTGFVPDADLPYLYKGAEVFVFPSIYEGFGLPVLEAMSYNTPVVTSNTSSLPEIAGDAAVLVDPSSPASIAQGINSVLSDSAKRNLMRQAGRRQARQFSWQRTAEQTYKVYQEVFTT